MPACHLMLYDAVCGLCNRVNRFVLARDRAGLFRFASLQSDAAREALRPHGRDPRSLDTFFVLADQGTVRERLLSRSDAALFVLEAVGGAWRLLSFFRAVPRPFRDLVYDLVARHRYRLFGRSETCPVPPPEHRARFIDL